ncbi:peptidyl-prolyl cis-trans isomerase [Fulvitalea axinellae]|uniref:Peptidyl-prolyl cis-trans isomerase n=1 Tax=Fulvitalea axinellae TaxID=1182444 RepID=A0AAU9CPS5_9BACT|nr:peptidyl-prolyl cis-trans isomerase [Fulvitalea axinellae]
MRTTFYALALLLGFSLWSCKASKDRPLKPGEDYLVTIHTEFGDMKAILYDQTPIHKENFVRLAKEGSFDETIFHRTIKDFMIQGGDVDAKEGAGTIDYTLEAEFVDSLFHKKGALAAAREGDNVNPEKRSSGSQFYIVQGQKFTKEELSLDIGRLYQSFQRLVALPEYDSLKQEVSKLQRAQNFEGIKALALERRGEMEKLFGVSFGKDYPEDRAEVYSTLGGVPHLDDAYTVFGQVVEGLDVVDKIAEQPTDNRDKPEKDIPMTVTLERISKKEIEKRYGIKL